MLKSTLAGSVLAAAAQGERDRGRRLDATVLDLIAGCLMVALGPEMLRRPVRRAVTKS
jgi:hypothetical protein